MFEQVFRNIDDVLRKESGCITELDCNEQISWLLFFKYLDALAHVACASPTVTRAERAAYAKRAIGKELNYKQQVFVDFVLSHYVSVGVSKLDREKLSLLLQLKYHNSVADAVADLGEPDEIGRVFVGFQKVLYQHQPDA